MFGFKLGNFQPIEVVGRSSETQREIKKDALFDHLINPEKLLDKAQI